MSVLRLDDELVGGGLWWARATTVPAVLGCLLVVAVLGALVGLTPLVAVGLVVVAATAAAVWVRPVTAAVLVACVTPLVAGIDRGRIFPVLRPHEALVTFLAAVLVLRAVVSAPTGHRWTLRLNGIEVCIVAMALANSIVPLSVMVMRGQEIAGDDLTYALVLWKYLALYAVVRASVRTEGDIRTCLWAAMFAATLVGIIGFLQALDLAGVRAALLGYYAPYGYTGALAAPRGGSTVGLPAATADLLILNFVTATGLWWKDRRHGAVLALVAAACIGGTLGAAEFSSAFGLAIAVVVTAVVCGRFGALRLAPLAVVGAGAALWPVIQHRLEGFESVSGLPVSWTTRVANLQNYFLPELLSGSNPILGVRPAARVVADHQGTGFVWVESGYVWLLWGGGVPLLLAFLAFVWVALRTLLPPARVLDSFTSVASLAAFVGVVVVTALMVFDPHLTYRGSADWLFSLLALAGAGARIDRGDRGGRPPTTADAADKSPTDPGGTRP